MKARAVNGETIEVTGCTLVDGISVEVTLTINTVQLIHKLGAKAAHAKGRKSQMASGLVKAVADKTGNQIVRCQARDKREAQRKRMDEAIAASRAKREAAGDVTW
jgi:hypothetical protein